MADTKISGATALNTTGILSTPVAKSGSSTSFRRVDNISASTAPDANDDSGDGYHAGSIWYKIDTADTYVCRDATSTAAVWHRRNSGLTRYKASSYFLFPQAMPVNTASSVVTAVTDVAKMFPFMLDTRLSISHLTYRVGTQANNLACAIYNANQTTGLPTTALASNTASAVGANGATREFALSSNAQIEPFTIYWAAINFSGSTATFIDCAPGGLMYLMGSALDGTVGGGGTSNHGYSTPLTCGTWSDLSSLTVGSGLTVVSGHATTLGMPCLGFKVASIP
jgi:hypothetical protein